MLPHCSSDMYQTCDTSCIHGLRQTGLKFIEVTCGWGITVFKKLSRNVLRQVKGNWLKYYSWYTKTYFKLKNLLKLVCNKYNLRYVVISDQLWNANTLGSLGLMESSEGLILMLDFGFFGLVPQGDRPKVTDLIGHPLSVTPAFSTYVSPQCLKSYNRRYLVQWSVTVDHWWQWSRHAWLEWVYERL